MSVDVVLVRSVYLTVDMASAAALVVSSSVSGLSTARLVLMAHGHI